MLLILKLSDQIDNWEQYEQSYLEYSKLLCQIQNLSEDFSIKYDNLVLDTKIEDRMSIKQLLEQLYNKLLTLCNLHEPNSLKNESMQKLHKFVTENYKDHIPTELIIDIKELKIKGKMRQFFIPQKITGENDIIASLLKGVRNLWLLFDEHKLLTITSAAASMTIQSRHLTSLLGMHKTILDKINNLMKNIDIKVSSRADEELLRFIIKSYLKHETTMLIAKYFNGWLINKAKKELLKKDS